MSLNISFLDPARGFHAGVSESQLFGVETSFEQGSIHGLKFSSIIDKCSYIEGGISHTDAYSNAVHASRTLVTMSEGGTTVFAGRVFSIGKGLDVTGSVKFCCEDCRGFLRESFIWYSKDPDYEEEEEENNGNESSDQYRARAGDNALDLFNAIMENHNYFMSLTYGQNFPYARINGLTGEQNLHYVNNDLALDGVSTYDALLQLFADQRLEWDLEFPLQLGINLRCAQRFTTAGGNISTGINLKSLTKTENADDIFSAILPVGGYGYNGRRITLSNHDFNTQEARNQINTDVEGILKYVQVWDPSKSEWVDSPDGERQTIIAINEALLNHYGLRIRTVIYDDVCCDSDDTYDIWAARYLLEQHAIEDAVDLNSDIIEWSCDAADLSAIGLGASFKLYGMYNISDRINGITATNCRMIKVTKNYDDPSKSTCSFEMPTSLLE